jgi:hypothetical protein
MYLGKYVTYMVIETHEIVAFRRPFQHLVILIRAGKFQAAISGACRSAGALGSLEISVGYGGGS